MHCKKNNFNIISNYTLGTLNKKIFELSYKLFLKHWILNNFLSSLKCLLSCYKKSYLFKKS